MCWRGTMIIKECFRWRVRTSFVRGSFYLSKVAVQDQLTVGMIYGTEFGKWTVQKKLSIFFGEQPTIVIRLGQIWNIGEWTLTIDVWNGGHLFFKCSRVKKVWAALGMLENPEYLARIDSALEVVRWDCLNFVNWRWQLVCGCGDLSVIILEKRGSTNQIMWLLNWLNVI